MRSVCKDTVVDVCVSVLVSVLALKRLKASFNLLLDVPGLNPSAGSFF